MPKNKRPNPMIRDLQAKRQKAEKASSTKGRKTIQAGSAAPPRPVRRPTP